MDISVLQLCIRLHCSFRNKCDRLGQPYFLAYFWPCNLLEASCVAIGHIILCEKEDLTKL